eukprot:scaffold448_cov135-Ochromonas_danica.AAC.2
MKGLESFAKPKEKCLLSSLFGSPDAINSSDSEGGEEDEKRAEGQLVEEEIIKRTFDSKLHSGKEIVVNERRKKGIAHQLWPAAEYLAEYIISHKNDIFDCRRPYLMVELGAGLGLTGLFLCNALKGFVDVKLLLTDLPEAVQGLWEGIEMNGLKSLASAAVLEWGNIDQAAQVDDYLEHGQRKLLIIASDVVYFEHLFEPLASTIRFLCERLGATVLLAHFKRWKKDQKFFVLCKRYGLKVVVLEEEVSFRPHEHTGQPEKTIRRVYSISSAAVENGESDLKSSIIYEHNAVI